jgi:hypothetical protein
MQRVLQKAHVGLLEEGRWHYVVASKRDDDHVFGLRLESASLCTARTRLQGGLL